MKWKLLKRGLAVLLSALLITSNVSVYAEELFPPTQTETNGVEGDSETEKLESNTESKPTEEPESTEKPESTEESKSTEESDSTKEPASTEEPEPTEEPTSEESGDSMSTEEFGTVEESESIEESDSTEESESAEESESESTKETEPTEEAASTEEFESETDSIDETETEIETETETEMVTEMAEVITFADIQDIVTYNTGNMEINVIPSEYYNEDLFESCLEDSINVVPFNEDGSFTIEAEADAFFPYEVQFQYDGRTENRWFLSPYDRASVNGHTFSIHSEFSGEVITQMNLSVAGKAITVYPEKKEFTNDGGVSAYSLMPLEERQLNVDLRGFNPLQLTRVAVSSVFAGEIGVSADKIAWSMSGRDAYEINAVGDMIDLSYSTEYGGTTWEMIAGDADQLNLSNVRYQIRIRTDESKGWLKPVVWQQKSDGTFTENLIKSYEYSDVTSYRTDASWSEFSNRYEEICLQYKVEGDGITYLMFDPSVFGNASVRVYKGKLDNPADMEYAEEVTSEIFGSQGYKFFGSREDFTFVSFDGEGNVTGFLPFYIYLVITNEYFSFHVKDVNNNSISAVSSSSSYMDGNCEFQVYDLYKGYSAEQQYFLEAYRWIDGWGRTGSEMAKGVAVYKGLYNTIEEAQSSGAEDIADAMFDDGIYGSYNQGVDFTFFLKDKVYQYNVKLQESDWQPTIHNNFDFRVYGVNDASGNYIKSYGIQTTEDSYAEYNYLTVLVDSSVDLTSLALRFSASNNAKVYCEDSITPEESGKTVHDFSKGAMKYRVSAENGENTTEYWIQVVRQDMSNVKLYVNSLTDPNSNTEIRDGVTYTTRKIMLDGTHGYVHDILLVNMGNADISNISVELDSEMVALDPYWTLSGNQSLGMFNKDQIDDDKAYGELSNLAKIRLIRKEGVPDNTAVTGTLTIKEAGRTILVMNLTGTVGDPTITTAELPVAVKYVPYEMKFQNENNYDKNTVTYSLQYNSELPDGMELKPTGEFYGVPRETGTFHIVVRMKSSIGDFQASTKEYDLVVLDNTDENVDSTVEAGYELTTKLSPVPSSSDYIVVSAGPYAEFRNVYIDGDQLVRNVDYEAEPGSTRITIRSETLSRKGAGTHTLGIEFREGGNDEGKLIRVAQNYNAEDIGVVQKPATGDDDNHTGSDNTGSSGAGSNNTGNNNAGNNNTGSGNTQSSSTQSTTNSNAMASPKTSDSSNSGKSGSVAIEAVLVQGALKEGYIMLQIDVSKDGVLRAEILNRYAGQKVYLNVIFSAGFGMTIDMFDIVHVSEDVKISYPLLPVRGMISGFDVIHAVPDAIKPLEFGAIFNFHVGNEYIGKKACIYVLNETGTGYNLVGVSTVNEIGNIAFVSDKVTDVIILIEE